MNLKAVSLFSSLSTASLIAVCAVQTDKITSSGLQELAGTYRISDCKGLGSEQVLEKLPKSMATIQLDRSTSTLKANVHFPGSDLAELSFVEERTPRLNTSGGSGSTATNATSQKSFRQNEATGETMMAKEQSESFIKETTRALVLSRKSTTQVCVNSGLNRCSGVFITDSVERTSLSKTFQGKDSILRLRYAKKKGATLLQDYTCRLTKAE